MRHNYVGDEGDYYKYALLRALCGKQRLGVVWYLYEGVCNPADGKKRTYLNDPKKFQGLDGVLYRKLRDFHKSGVEPHIKEVKKHQWIIPNSIFFEKSLFHKERKRWLAEAKLTVRDCNIVFLDPDNGLEPKNVRKPEKYVFYDEAAGFWESKKINVLVIYQHQIRKKREIHIQECIAKLYAVLKSAPVLICAVVFGSRFFFVVIKNDPGKTIERQLQEFATKAAKYCYLNCHSRESGNPSNQKDGSSGQARG